MDGGKPSKPPIVKMLEEYLPRLPARQSFDGHVLPPPPPIIKQLKKAITSRNGLTHAGAESLKGDSLKEALNAIEDVLWLLDYYAGGEWALHHMRKETRVALTGKAEN